MGILTLNLPSSPSSRRQWWIFLTDEQHCDNHPTWSYAFASRLRESLKTSSILNFIVDEQDTEENCAIVYSALEVHLTTGDVTIARAFANWQALFKLKCAYRDDFLTFYSKSKGNYIMVNGEESNLIPLRVAGGTFEVDVASTRDS